MVTTIAFNNQRTMPEITTLIVLIYIAMDTYMSYFHLKLHNFYDSIFPGSPCCTMFVCF
jgi:hypothetical protein